MPRGDKSKYTDKQKRMEEHIEQGYEKRGVPEREAERRAWATGTKQMEADYPVLKRDYPLNEKNLDWWASDKDSPYTEVKRFDWYRGYHVGGRSLMWGRQSYRWSDFDFEANAREGVGTDWPIRYADIAPWYDHVEKFAGISGSIEHMPQLPDGEFQPPMPFNCGEEMVASRVRQHFDGKRRWIPSRTANLTLPLPPGRSAC